MPHPIARGLCCFLGLFSLLNLAGELLSPGFDELVLPYAIRAFKRSGGEYLVFLEDNRNAKNILFRWRPEAAIK